MFVVHTATSVWGSTSGAILQQKPTSISEKVSVKEAPSTVTANGLLVEKGDLA